MPVAVDTLSEEALTGQSDSIDTSLSAPQDSPKKARGPRKNKRLESETAEQPIAGSSTITDEWAWRSLTESSASNVSPVFTRDGRCVIRSVVPAFCSRFVPSYFFSASGSAVKIHSVETGHIVSTLSPTHLRSKPGEATGYGDAVTSMVLSPHNPFQLLTASMDGCIRLWDFVDAVLLQTIDISKPILQITAHEKFKNEVCVAISRGTKKLNANRTS